MKRLALFAALLLTSCTGASACFFDFPFPSPRYSYYDDDYDYGPRFYRSYASEPLFFAPRRKHSRYRVIRVLRRW